ncbi:MAG TPA: methyltransferase [Thermoplasmata archaeon]|nr:methyltransferase [Thermoplasmata archaeon]
MRSLAVVVPRTDGERTRRRLRELGLLRTDLAVGHVGERLAFPVHAGPTETWANATVEEQEFEEMVETSPASYAELALVPEEVRTALPRAFDVVGDVVLVRLDADQARWGSAIGAALRAFVPGARLVAWDRGVHGEHRVRTLVPLAGEGGFRTVHRENGLAFQIDLQRAYFSPRLGREHARVAAAGRPGEEVLDLCCGIGPFGLTLLRSAKSRRATFVDVNPDAIALVEENARRLGVADRVRALAVDLERFLADAPVAERVVFNLPHGGIKYVAQVSNAVARGGTLHYYEIMERSAVAARLAALPASFAGPWSLREHHIVHPYSPSSDLVAVTLDRLGE